MIISKGGIIVYRQYEDAMRLGDKLMELIIEHDYLIARSEPKFSDRIIEIKIEMEELRQRINFAWQDWYEEFV